MKELMRSWKLIVTLFLLMMGPQVLVRVAGAEPSAQHVAVTAKKFAIEPAVITVKKGEPVDLVLKSSDVPHGLRFRELKVDVRVGKGGTAEVHFTPNQTGTFVGHCSVFCGMGHGSMTLTLRVVD
jgi:cytochrome c oxidase subunit 2